VVDAEPAEGMLAAGGDVLRAADDGATAPRTAYQPELAGQHHLVAAGLQGPADELLVLAFGVAVGGVQEGDTVILPS
jgi:hypothetical protein